MAFVFETERKLNDTNRLGNPTGPGQYNIQAQQQLHTSAPFHSSSLRKTIFAPTDKSRPGPGEYQVSRPIVEPNIKSVSNSHSIILKINSTGTAQFKSTDPRFRNEQQTVPGPGKYVQDKPLLKERADSVSSHPRESLRKIREIAQAQNSNKIAAIPNKYRGLTDSKKQDEVPDVQRLGPAHYNPNKTFHVNSSSTVWGKDKTKRFVADRRIALGPGQYKADYKPSRPDQKAGLHSQSFRSATARSYFDSLIYHSNVQATVKERAQSLFKTKQPSPGQYNDFSSSFVLKQKPFSFQFFGSTVQRFAQQQPLLSLKPKKNAFYYIRSELGKNLSFNRGNHGFNSLTERQNQFLGQKNREKIPGPGQYKEKVVVQKKLKGARVQKFGSTTDRPFFKPQEHDEMGPGKYQKNENIQEFVKTRFGQIKNTSSTFKSNTNRECFGPNKGEKILGQYDLTYNDLSKKQQRQRMFLQNLKKIQVQRPAFESSHTRFPHYDPAKTSSVKEKEKKNSFTREQELKIKQDNQRARSVVIETNRAQLKETKLFGAFDRQDRFGGYKKGAPGAGAYATQDKWQKKSYNVKYQKK